MAMMNDIGLMMRLRKADDVKRDGRKRRREMEYFGREDISTLLFTITTKKE